MYINSFGIMFHHFHDEKKHIRSQGSISSNTFRNMLRYLTKDFDIVDADIWYAKAMSNELKPNQICLTFDDALACQYDIAYPVLKEQNIKAFWFLYTSMYKGALEKLEIYRHYRFKSFDSIDLFYDAFFKTAISSQDTIRIDIEKEIKQFDPRNYLQQFSFYTDSDKLFRYLRDCILGQEKYYLIMDNMIMASGYDIEANKSLLWINEYQILKLHKDKHIIGLHSHSHPTTMSAKPYNEQMTEYRENKHILEGIIQDKIYSISYPCNSYNDDTDRIMNELGISLGFDAVMSDSQHGNLHFPRKDHAYSLKEMAM